MELPFADPLIFVFVLAYGSVGAQSSGFEDFTRCVDCRNLYRCYCWVRLEHFKGGRG